MKGEARNCAECGGPVSMRILPHYKDLQIGVAVDLINAVEEITCKSCREQEVSFPDFNGLLAAIAVLRVRTAIKLNGEEIKFLRKALELTAKKLAVHLGMREETISRWENGKENMSPPAEKLLRVLVAETLADQTPGIPISEMEILYMPILQIREQHRRLRLILQYRKTAHTEKSQIAQESSKGAYWEELPKAA
jgi:putative zinc finger/helix-turn-helix YgiT family protein